MNETLETSVIIPSVVGVGRTDMGMLTAGNLRRASTELPYTVNWNGTPYLVGQAVEKYAPVSERMDFLRLGDSEQARALTYAILSQLAGPAHTLTASLMVGFPVEVMMNRELATQLLRELRAWLVGEHRFTVDEQEYFIIITNIQVAAQPAGAFFAWGMSNTGKWVRSSDDLDVMVAVGDLGFNTLDIIAVEGGSVVGKYSGGDTAGIRRAAELLMRQVKEKYEVSLSRYDADKYLRTEHPILSCWRGEVDLAPLAAQALETAAAGIGDFMETRWGNGKQFRYLLFTGGGSEMVRSHLLRRYPHAQILPNPVLANALGLARYGRRIFKNAETVIGLDPGFGGFKAVCLDNA